MNNVNIETIFSLKYVTRRFINIVVNSFFKCEKFNYVIFTQRFFYRPIIFSQNNDILLSIFRKALLKVSTIIRF